MVEPTCAVPEIVGSDVFTGAPATTPLAADEAAVEPTLFVAITTTTTVEPTSAAASVYEDCVAPTTSTQLPPAESQRRHW